MAYGLKVMLDLAYGPKVKLDTAYGFTCIDSAVKAVPYGLRWSSAVAGDLI